MMGEDSKALAETETEMSPRPRLFHALHGPKVNQNVALLLLPAHILQYSMY